MKYPYHDARFTISKKTKVMVSLKNVHLLKKVVLFAYGNKYTNDYEFLISNGS